MKCLYRLAQGRSVDGSQGRFELNVTKLAYCMMHSLQPLADVARRSFTEHCVEGIRANEKRIQELMERSLMLVTARAFASGTSLKEEAVRLGLSPPLNSIAWFSRAK
jgi:fumarate hydratase class II